MQLAVPAIAILLESFAYFQLGVVRTAIILLLMLAVWIGVLENAKSGGPRRDLTPYLRWWALYAALIFVSILVNSTSLKEDILIYLPGQALFAYFFSCPRLRSRYFVGLLAGVTVLHASLGLFQYAAPSAFDSIFAGLMGEASAANYHFVIGRITGTWGDAVRLGVVLAAGYPFVLLQVRQKRSVASVLALCLVLLACLLTFTRVALVSVILSTFVVMWDARVGLLRRVAPVVVAALVFALAVQMLPIGQQVRRLYGTESVRAEYATDLEDYNRGRVLAALAPYVLERPLTGVGLSYKRYLASGFSSAHNSYLQSALLFGIPATVLLLGLLIALVNALRRCVRRPGTELAIAGLLGALAVAIGGSAHGVLFDGPLNALFWMCAGLGLRQALDVAAEERGLA